MIFDKKTEYQSGTHTYEKGPVKKIEAGLFVCVEVLRPSQPNGVMLSAVSLPNCTFTGQA